MKKKAKKYAFTFIELVAVISILTILAAIGIVSYISYLSESRDATRIAHLSEIEKAFNNHKLNAKFPLPDRDVEVRVDNLLAGYQGYLSDDILKTVKYTGINGGIDPKDGEYYTYYVSKDLRKFQILGFLEHDNENKIKSFYINKANAKLVDFTDRFGYMVGDKLGVLVQNETNIPIQYIPEIQSQGFINFTGSLIGEYKLNIENGDIYKSNDNLIMGGKIKELAYLKETKVIGATGSEICGGSIADPNGISNALSQSSSINWNRSSIPGICTWDCKSGYSWDEPSYSCKQDLIVSGSFGLNASGAIINVSGINEIADANGNFSTTRSYGSNVYGITATKAGYNCTTSVDGPTYLTTNVTNISGNCTENLYANCTSTGLILSATTTYPGVSTTGYQPAHPGCNIPDIIVCTGVATGHTLSACNIGTEIAGIDVGSHGWYFQWGRNKGALSGQQSTTISGTVGLDASTDTYGFVWYPGIPYPPGSWANSSIDNNWGHITNTNIARQGPCANGYHVPTNIEWREVHAAGGWGDNGNAMSNVLKLPKAGFKSKYDGVIYDVNYSGFYASSSKNSSDYDIYYLMFNGFNIDPISSYDFHKADGLPVRCFKN